MMKKLLFAGTAVLALSATAVQAETVTNGGVTYSYTPGTVIYDTTSITPNTSISLSGVTSGFVERSGQINVERNAVVSNNDLVATGVVAASVTFESWTVTSDPITVNDNSNNGDNAAGSDIYNSQMALVYGNSTYNVSDTVFFTYDEMMANIDGDNGCKINDSEVEDTESGSINFYIGDKTPVQGKNLAKKVTNLAKVADYDICYYYRKCIVDYDDEADEYYKTVGYYAITFVRNSVMTSTVTTTVSNYNVTTIPAGVLNADVATLTIGSSITTIADNAFENATGITYVAASGKYTAVNSTYLYTADEGTLLYVTKNYQSESLVLSALTKSVGNYATVGLTSDKIIYYSSTSLSIGSNQGATFISKTPSITWASRNDQMYTAAATSYVNATVLKDALESLEGSTACVDLRKAKLATDITLSVNYGNIMVILPSDQGVSVGGTNVIYLGSDGYVCEDFVLNDSYSTNGFYTPIAFTATEANYDRKFTSNNSTVCLPFSFTVPNTLTVATMVNSNSEGVIFAEVTETQAGKPYLIFSNSDNATIPTMRNVSVSATTSSNKIGEYEMIGVYEPTTLSAADGNFYGFSSNSLVKITGTATANVKAFRAYLSVEGGSAATMRVSIEAENETNAIEELEATNDDDAAVYNLNGQKINSKAAGFQILSNGTKKIIK